MSVGRKSVLTDTVIDKICEAYEIGATYKICADYAGVSEGSVMGWKRAGEEIQKRIDDGEELELSDYQLQIMKFLRKLTAAGANDAMNLLQVIDKAASNDPVWAEKRLMRRYPEMIIAARNEMTGAGGGALKTESVTTVIYLPDNGRDNSDTTPA